MEEDQSLQQSREEQSSLNIMNEPHPLHRFHQQSFYESTLSPNSLYPMFGLYSPSPFKREIMVEVQEQSDEGDELYHKPPPPFQLDPAKMREDCQMAEVERYSHVRGTKKIKEKKNLEKGLKQLSKHVYEIILELKSATYKEIATQLLQNFPQEGCEGPLTYREEQNIRRRVYDALNVLIAAGLLEKDGKKVFLESKIKNQIKTQISSIASEERPERNRLITEKEQAIGEKVQRLQDLREKYQNLKMLMGRNQQSEARESRIKFPLMWVSFDERKSSSIYQMRRKQQLCLKVGELLEIGGDADVIPHCKFS